jgi:type II secretory pathway predicted ATPase ExeA
MLATREIMEEFRGLLNLEVPERKLLSFVFFGLPEIEDNLRLDPPLAQRVSLKYRLEPLSAEASEAYVRHRLRLAGAPRVPFTQAALARLHAHSRGTPRLINTLCDNALFEGFIARSREIDDRFVDRVARDLGVEAQGEPPPRPGRPSDRPRLDLAEIDRYLDSLK